jgi:chorismate mutase
VSFDGPGVADVDEDSAGEYRSDNNNNTYDDQREAEVSSKTSQSSLVDITTAQSEAY